MSREEYFHELLTENGWVPFDVVSWADGKDSVIYLTKYTLLLVRNVLNRAMTHEWPPEVTCEQDEVRIERERPGGIDTLEHLSFSQNYVLRHGRPRVPPLSG